MEYLKSALSLKTLINGLNADLLERKDEVTRNPNHMWVKTGDGNIRRIVMESFSNEFVRETLEGESGSEAFVVTDLASMNINGKDMTYLLFKGYQRDLEKGMVFFQILDEETLAPRGDLQFSNMEDNIFYPFHSPGGEESSCNAMETDKEIEEGKSIVFFIGHMDEERLVYDVQRLIIDTVHNVMKHPRLRFEFIVQITRYGENPTAGLKKGIEKIARYTEEHILKEYPDRFFEFTFDQEAS